MFRRPTIRYGQTPEPTTPYQRAAQVWDDRIGSARVQAKNWRLAFFGALALSGGLGAGIVWQSARGHIVPWVVQVDRLGEAQAVRHLFLEDDFRVTTGNDVHLVLGGVQTIQQSLGVNRAAGAGDGHKDSHGRKAWFFQGFFGKQFTHIC